MYHEYNDRVKGWQWAVTIVTLGILIVMGSYLFSKERVCLKEGIVKTVIPVGHKTRTSYFVTLTDGTNHELEQIVNEGQKVCVVYRR